MKKTVLITGANGYLGKALINNLLKNTPWQIVAQCRKRSHCKQFTDYKQIIPITGNLLQPETFSTILTTYTPEIIIHLAAIARFNDGQAKPTEALLTNFFGTIDLIRVAEKTGTKKFIFTSSDLARNALSVVGIGKLLVEYFIQSQGNQNMNSMVLRLPNIYNSPATVFDIFKRQIKNNEDLTITDPGMARRFVTTEESCYFLYQLIEKGKGQSVYAINREPLYIKDLASQMIKQSGKALNIRFIGAKPGEKLYEASYSSDEISERIGKKLVRLKTLLPLPKEIQMRIGLLPVKDEMKKEIFDIFNKIKH